MKPNRDTIGALLGALSTAIVLLVVVALGSCTNEPVGLSMPGGDGIQVRVTFPRSEATRAVTGGTEIGTPDENRLDRVTILVFNGDGTQLETVLSEDVRSSNTSLPTSQPKWASDQTLIVSPMVDPKSPKTIYAIANWSKVDFDKTTYTEAALKDELTTILAVAAINGSAAYPMLMSGSKQVTSLTSLLYNVTVDMERQASKIRATLTLPIDVQEYSPQIEWQTELMKITVVNVPNKSYIVGRKASPAGVTSLNSDPIAVDDIKPAAGDQQVPATKDLKWSKSVYITENPVTGATQAAKDASTHIIVQLPYKNRITGITDLDNYYKLYINDTRDATSPHKVLRNTIYNLSISILGLGLPINNLVPDINVDDVLTVNSWDKGEIGDVEAPQSYFNVNRTHIGFQSFETSFQATIATDVANWKLVKPDGTTAFCFAEQTTNSVTIDGITYTLSGTASAATITVSKPTTLIDFPTQNLTFIAKNLKVPFTVAYDNGFIPNSVLTQSFTVEGVTYAGWPADKLPKTGLQLAKQGNQILPSGVAEEMYPIDPNKMWKTTETTTAGVETVSDRGDAKLGMGKSSTDAMVATPALAAEHPAANYCREMGPDWYLPSVVELILIFNNESMLGDSYPLRGAGYWSSTQDDYKYEGWYVYGAPSLAAPASSPPSVLVNPIIKTRSLSVRCVREI